MFFVVCINCDVMFCIIIFVLVYIIGNFLFLILCIGSIRIREEISSFIVNFRVCFCFIKINIKIGVRFFKIRISIFISFCLFGFVR